MSMTANMPSGLRTDKLVPGPNLGPESGARMDVSRFEPQVTNEIGLLGARTVLLDKRGQFLK